MRQNCFSENSLVTVPYPPCSLDLAPSGFRFFVHIKTSLAGGLFNDVDEPLEMVIEFLTKIQPSELQFVFTTGANERNGSSPTMETTITSKQHILNSRGHFFSGRSRPLFINHPIYMESPADNTLRADGNRRADSNILPSSNRSGDVNLSADADPLLDLIEHRTKILGAHIRIKFNFRGRISIHVFLHV
jgi:hypothetical protein